MPQKLLNISVKSHIEKTNESRLEQVSKAESLLKTFPNKGECLKMAGRRKLMLPDPSNSRTAQGIMKTVSIGLSVKIQIMLY